MIDDRDKDGYMQVHQVEGLHAYTIMTSASGFFLIIATFYITNEFIELAPSNSANHNLIYVLVLCTLLSFMMVWSSVKKAKLLIGYFISNNRSLKDVDSLHTGIFRKTRAVDLTVLLIASILPLIFMGFTALQMRELNRSDLLMQSGIIVWYCALFVLLAVIALFGFVSYNKCKAIILNNIANES